MIIKNCNSLVKIFSLLMISVFFISSSVSAQQLPGQPSPEPAEYSDDELVVFVKAAQAVMPIQQESQMKMIQEIEKQDLTVDKFNNILEARRTGHDVEASEQDLTSFNNAVQKIEEIQVEYEDVITETIEGAGISAMKYDEIINNYQRDPQLQMRVNTIMDEMQQQQ